MKYSGKLYGKVGGEYFPLMETTEDVETLKKRVAELKLDKNQLPINVENLKRFFQDRQKLSPSGISQEAGFSAKYLRLILSGERPLTDTAIAKLKPVLHLHGWGRERKEKE